MLEQLLAALLGALASFLRDLLADWRRDRALEEKGAAESEARVTRETADAEARMREANARPRDDRSVLDRLRDGAA